MDYQVKVTRVSEEVGVDEQGRVVPIMRVEFMCGQNGPFIEKIPKADYQPQLVRAKIEDFARGLQQLGQ